MPPKAMGQRCKAAEQGAAARLEGPRAEALLALIDKRPGIVREELAGN